MTCLEHYFENLLHHNKDIKGEPNKKALTKEEQKAVETCVQYVRWTLLPVLKEIIYAKLLDIGINGYSEDEAWEIAEEIIKEYKNE